MYLFIFIFICLVPSFLCVTLLLGQVTLSGLQWGRDGWFHRLILLLPYFFRKSFPTLCVLCSPLFSFLDHINISLVLGSLFYIYLATARFSDPSGAIVRQLRKLSISKWGPIPQRRRLLILSCLHSVSEYTLSPQRLSQLQDHLYKPPAFVTIVGGQCIGKNQGWERDRLIMFIS